MDLGDTYAAPSMKRTEIPIRLFIGMWSLETRYSGKIKRMVSNAMLVLNSATCTW